jgi:putative ABC transport system substrate-binding protein
MRRRDVVALLGGAAAWPLAASAQRPIARRVGVLLATAPGDPEFTSYSSALTEALQKLGWEQGRNLQIDFRSFAGDAARAGVSARELVALQPDLIVSHATVAARALLRETRTIPIVFVQVIDPVSQGLMESLARPQGNITGFTNFEPEIGSKWLKLLKDIAPRLKRVGILFDPATAPFAGYFVRSVEAAVPLLDVSAVPVRIDGTGGLDRALGETAAVPDSGLIVVPHPFTVINRELVVALSAKHRLPVIYPYRFFVSAGGLLSYGVDIAEVFRDAATYVDRILRGMDPRELPVQAPTRFELTINMKTAKALGLEVSSTLLALADEVIE